MSQGEVTSEAQARAILRLAADAPPSAWRPAFQREVKAAHPDQGGDDARVRLVIEAYRFLNAAEAGVRKPPPRPARPAPAQRARPVRAKAAPRSPAPEPPAEPVLDGQRQARLRIAIVDAFRGCDRTVRLADGRRIKVRLPPGLQTGDVLRFGEAGEHRVAIDVASMAGAAMDGADLWLTVAVSEEFLREGGRMEVDTPLGQRRFWVSRTSAARGVYRCPGEGLAARPGRARGCLYLRFQLDETLKQSPARSLLARFAAAWAAP